MNRNTKKMKRVSAIVILSMILVMLMAVPAMAASELKVESTTPKDGATGQSVDNMGVKVYFNKPIYDKDNREANVAKCHLTDEKGKEIKTKVAFSSSDKKVMLVVADTTKLSKKEMQKTIKSNSTYHLHIDSGLKAADGSTMGEYELSFKTLNQKTQMYVSFAMMAVMVGGMIFFTTRETKKQAKEMAESKGKYKSINPYQEAKRTGKSVEEIIAREEKRKAKFEEAVEKQRRKQQKERAALEDMDDKEESKPNTKRVSAPAPISAAGSTYKYVKPVKQNSGKSTNPKNQSAKKKNKNKKH